MVKIEDESRDNDVQQLIELFNSLDTGADYASKYESLCTEALKYIFDNFLAGWVNQNNTTDELHRMDLVCRIKRGNEFWDFIKEDFNVGISYLNLRITMNK